MNIWGNGTVSGTEDHDTIIGSGGPDNFSGLGGDDTLIGNEGDDTIDGGFGNDDLAGSAGADLLIGGDGDDTFHFHTRFSGVDTVQDFDTKADRILIYDDSSTTIGTDIDWSFVKGGKNDAVDEPTVIYQKKSGKLFYDDDGKGGDSAQLLAKISDDLKVKANDFDVIG